MSDEDDAGQRDDAPDGGHGDRGDAQDRGGDRGPDRGEGRGGRDSRDRDGRDRDGDRAGASERTDGTAEQPREPSVFAAADRGPLGGESDTGGAATARRAVRTWAGGGADRLTTIHGDGTVFEGNQIFALYGSDRTSHFVQGPVPPETLDHLGRVYCATAGYRRMRDRLRDHRVLVLCGEPGSGRKATALALLDELTGGKVFRLDPRHGVDEITEDVLQESGGHLLELLAEDIRTESEPLTHRSGRGEHTGVARRPAARLSELHLDRFGDLLRGRDAYGVVLVENGELADRLLRGRYGMYCAPPPADEVLHRHLWHQLRTESDEATGAARARAAQQDVVAALGLEELRPREAARLADHLARHWRGDVTDEQLLAECSSFVRSQAREWFAGADRPGALPEALPALGAGAFRIAVAVFNGSAYSLAAEAAELLAWELAVTLDPEHPPGRRLFGTHAEHRPVQARAVLEDGELDLGPAKVPVRAVRFQGEALAGAVLGEIWHGYHNVRGPVARWLRSLCDDARPEVWVRASVAARRALLLGLDPRLPRAGRAARGDGRAEGPDGRRHRARRGRARSARPARRRRRPQELGKLRLGQPGQDRPARPRLCARRRKRLRLARRPRPGRQDPRGDRRRGPRARLLQRGSAARLRRTRPRPAAAPPVARGRPAQPRQPGPPRRHPRPEHPDHPPLGAAGGPRTRRARGPPLLVALLATRPELASELASLLRHALATARSGEAALEALGSLLRRAAKDPEALGHVCAFLPRLAVDRRDRDRLRGLLNELVRDRDRPLDRGAARRMWNAVTEGANR